MEIKILAKSSNRREPYEVYFYFKSGELSGFCNCPAGIYYKFCKHKIALLTGDESALYDLSERDNLLIVQDWVAKTTYLELLNDYNETKKLLDKTKNKMDKLKKKLEDAMKQGLEK